MARDTARKIERSPNGDHALVQRNANGVVQMSQRTSFSNTSVTATGGTTVASTSAGTPNLVAFDAGTMTLSSGGTVSANATPFTIELRIDGSAVTSATAQTTTATISLDAGTTRTNTTPLNDPNYTFFADVPGGSVTVAGTASRESRWI